MKIVQKIRALMPVLFLAALVLASVGGAQAQTTGTDQTQANKQVALTAVPPRLGDDYSLVVQPGQTVQAVIEVRNPSDYAATVETFARDFIIGADGETPIAVEDGSVDPKWQLSQWLTLTPNNAVIQPRGSSTIIVTIDVPADALPGGRYAMVLHKPVTGDGQVQSTGAQVTAQVGTLLYVIVDGPVTEDASITNFDFKGFNEMGPVPYSFDLVNDSSLHVRPEMTITITNMFGQKSGEIAVDQKNIFPASSRGFIGQWDKTWGFGRYTAEISGTYGTQSSVITAQTTFWIIPIRIILAVLLVIVLVAVVIMSTKKKYSKMLEVEEEKVRKLDEKLKKARKK